MKIDRHKKWFGPIHRIQAIVCREFGVTMIEMRSRRRNKTIIAPRHIAMWICRRLTLASLPTIGFHFGNRDHTTIIHGCRNAEVLMESSLDLKEKTENIVMRWGNELIEETAE